MLYRWNIQLGVHIMTYLAYFGILGKDWLHVGLDEFMACESNLATNRQTRMLADLALVGCYNQSAMSKHERDRVMLASAKRNLAAMAYFGLTEYQKVNSNKLALSLHLIIWQTIDITIYFRRNLQSPVCHTI